MPKRNYNVDLFRSLAAVLVVLLHVLLQGGILENTSPSSAKHWAAWFFEIAAYCAVDCFALISGYLMVGKSIKLRNIFKLWFQVLSYSLLITLLFFAFVPASRSIKSLVLSLLPVLSKQWWYVSAYFALFFFIPFLNKAIENISQQTYKKFLIVAIIGVCCLSPVLYTVFYIDTFTLDNGYSAIWLMLVYMFGAYIRKYDLREKITASRSLLGFFAMIILTFAFRIIVYFATERIFGQAKYYDMLVSYVSVTILLSAVFLFLFCLNIKIKENAEKLIAFISPAALGVYLIHVHPLIFEGILKDAFVSFTDKSLIAMLACVILATLAIFAVCAVIELLRIRVFKLIKIDSLCIFIENKLKGLYLKVFKS